MTVALYRVADESDSCASAGDATTLAQSLVNYLKIFFGEDVATNEESLFVSDACIPCDDQCYSQDVSSFVSQIIATNPGSYHFSVILTASQTYYTSYENPIGSVSSAFTYTNVPIIFSLSALSNDSATKEQ